jgi:CheY-like chemotaxis protein/HPt (histidine-containing phosphotransfer) domain-containing protein
VLVAEDQPSSRNVIRRQLAKLDIEPLIVNDGREAYAAFIAAPFDLIITDCHMPNVNGFELTRMIRRFEVGQGAHVPILAFTANALKGEAEFCFAAGMDAYIVKPARLAQLSQKIGELLGAGSSLAPHGPIPGDASADQPVDLRALAAMVGEDDIEELRSIVLEYLATAGPTFSRARIAMERHDAVDLTEAAHAGKGSALNVCAGPLAHAWRALEDAARERDFDAVAAHIESLETRFHDLQRGSLW